jgi:hypothetical protein
MRLPRERQVRATEVLFHDLGTADEEYSSIYPDCMSLTLDRRVVVPAPFPERFAHMVLSGQLASGSMPDRWYKASRNVGDLLSISLRYLRSRVFTHSDSDARHLAEALAARFTDGFAHSLRDTLVEETLSDFDVRFPTVADLHMHNVARFIYHEREMCVQRRLLFSPHVNPTLLCSDDSSSSSSSSSSVAQSRSFIPSPLFDRLSSTDREFYRYITLVHAASSEAIFTHLLCVPTPTYSSSLWPVHPGDQPHRELPSEMGSGPLADMLTTPDLVFGRVSDLFRAALRGCRTLGLIPRLFATPTVFAYITGDRLCDVQRWQSSHPANSGPPPFRFVADVDDRLSPVAQLLAYHDSLTRHLRDLSCGVRRTWTAARLSSLATRTRLCVEKSSTWWRRFNWLKKLCSPPTPTVYRLLESTCVSRFVTGPLPQLSPTGAPSLDELLGTIRRMTILVTLSLTQKR